MKAHIDLGHSEPHSFNAKLDGISNRTLASAGYDISFSDLCHNGFDAAEGSQHYNFNFPYLADNTRSVAKADGAVCTPDFFGFNANLELQYRGRLDNLTMGMGGTRIPELFDAMHMIANTGSGPVSQIASMGCSIKWK